MFLQSTDPDFMRSFAYFMAYFRVSHHVVIHSGCCDTIVAKSKQISITTAHIDSDLRSGDTSRTARR